MLYDTSANGISEIGPFAIAIAQVSDDQNHTGILYRDDDGKLWFLHLAWNYKLLSGTFPLTYQWAATIRPTSVLKFLAVICENIRLANPPIPYGLDRTGIVFSPTTGEMLPGENGKGLTCASFILAVLDTFNISLLKEEEWPLDANLQWQEKVVFYLGETQAPPDQIQAVMRDIGRSRRFTPNEVLGASTEALWPVTFDRASELAILVESELHPHTAHVGLVR